MCFLAKGYCKIKEIRVGYGTFPYAMHFYSDTPSAHGSFIHPSWLSQPMIGILNFSESLFISIMDSHSNLNSFTWEHAQTYLGIQHFLMHTELGVTIIELTSE